MISSSENLKNKNKNEERKLFTQANIKENGELSITASSPS
jgi:hypothetical protein